MMKLIPFLLLAVVVLLLSGCVCGYEDVRWHEVTIMDVPAKVMRAFQNANPNVCVERIERNIFKGRTVNYNFYFRKHDNVIATAGVTLDGHVTEYEQKLTPK